MEINRVNTQSSNPVLSGASNVAVASPKAQNATQGLGLSQTQQVSDTQKTPEQRLDTIVQAASAFKDVYAVSDTTFTIFKDSSGQFVTRFKSLKDGAITYIPEPDISRFVESNNSRVDSSV